MVREHERDLLPVFALFLDLDHRGRAGLGRKSTLEYLVRIGASLLWAAYKRAEVVSLVAEGERRILLPPGQGELHLTAALHELIRARQNGTLPLLELVERHREELPQGSTAVLLAATPEMDAAQLGRTVEALRATAVRPVVVVVDALAFPPVDRPPVPIETAHAIRRELEDRLLSLEVPSVFCGPGEAPEQTLRRPDFLSITAEV